MLKNENQVLKARIAELEARTVSSISTDDVQPVPSVPKDGAAPTADVPSASTDGASLAADEQLQVKKRCI